MAKKHFEVDQLTEDDTQVVMDWFYRFIGDRGCAVCGAKDWSPDDAFFTETVFSRAKDRHQHGTVMLTVKIHCNNCSNILTFAAKDMGFQTKHNVLETGNE